MDVILVVENLVAMGVPLGRFPQPMFQLTANVNLVDKFTDDFQSCLVLCQVCQQVAFATVRIVLNV